MSHALLAVDPGEVHVGTALFKDGECVSVKEMEPEVFIDRLRGRLQMRALDVLVVEEFRLFPWLADQQSYSEMETSQLIGQIRLVHRWWGGGCALELQPASIKKPTKAQMRARGISSLAKSQGAGGHCADAELHGQHYVLRHVTNVTSAPT